MSLTSRLRALERYIPTEPNPWLGCQFWRVAPGEDVATNEKTGERRPVDDVPAYSVLVMVPGEVTNEPHDQTGETRAPGRRRMSSVWRGADHVSPDPRPERAEGGAHSLPALWPPAAGAVHDRD